MLNAVKKATSIILFCTLLLVLFVLNPTMVSAMTYTDADEISGSDYTSRPELAEALDNIFAGNASIYSNKKCTKLVNTALGTKSVPNNGVKQYIGEYGKNGKTHGTSCWIYANGVYLTLFGEVLYNGTPGDNSEKLDLGSTSNKKLTYENMCDWGVYHGVGAQIRIERQSRSSEHSIIVLGYNEDGLTYLDGNGDGKGLVAVRELTWEKVRTTKAINGTVKYIIQPKTSYMDELYPCSHSYNDFYLCEECGAVDAKTIRIGYGEGTVFVSDATGCTIRKTPYSVCKGDAYTMFLLNGTKVNIIEVVENDVGNRWYKIRLGDGSFWYVYHERIRLSNAAKIIFKVK